MAGTYALVIEQGATFRRVFTWADENDAPIDLTNLTARAQLREKHKSTGVLLEATTENGRLTLGGTAGTITLVIDAVTTAALVAGRGVWDLEVVFSPTDVVRLLEGPCTVTPEVTR